MEDFLKNKYGIDINTPLSGETESPQVGDVVDLIRKNGSEKNVIHNLHNGALNKRQALEYLDNIKNQLVLKVIL
jgi:hypothetical protein